jgi:hypothetical protein
MRPTQPIHFAHGYDWMALFFLGAAPLITTLEYILTISRPWVRRGALILLMGLFLLDNSAWLAKIAIRNNLAISLTKSQSAALHWLRGNLRAGDMVVSQDDVLGYLVSTYTPARSWQGHDRNTPSIELRHSEVEHFFNEGRVLPEWKRPGVFYVSAAAWVPPAGLHLVRRCTDSEFSIWASAQP